MKIISWNINGINSALKDGLLGFLKKSDAEIICLQEVKSHWDRMDDSLKNIDDYHIYSCEAKKRGYSGLLVYSKDEPVSITKGIGDKKIDDEGRVLTLEFESFYLINVYFPHTRRDLSRMDFKQEFNKKFEKYCEKLQKTSRCKLGEGKPLIIAGDFNVAHKEIDLANPKQNKKNAGFTPEEREWFDSFLKKGYIDTFREFEKGEGFYTWWTYRANARARNIGWRIDYFLITDDLKHNLVNSRILPKVMGSDHCPIELYVS